MQHVPGLAGSSSRSEDSQEEHDQHITSNASHDNAQLQILSLIQGITRDLKENGDG